MLWVCLSCSTAYAPAPACPHCGSVEYAEQGTEQAEMAKISRHGGPTYDPTREAEVAEAAVAAEEVVEEEAVAEELAEVATPEEAEEAAVEEEVEPINPYEGWLLADLQAECETRGLVKSGNKAELVARLIEDDAG